jgi:hypothetical protein
VYIIKLIETRLFDIDESVKWLVTGWTTWVWFPANAGIFLFATAYRVVPRPTQFIQWVPRALYEGVKLPRRRGDSLPRSAEVKNAWICTSGTMLKVMVKVSQGFIFNWAPRRLGVLGEWIYSSTHSWPRHYMEVSGQLHAPAVLPPWKEDLLYRRLGGAPEPVWTRWWRQKFLAPTGTRTSDHPARSPGLCHWAIPAPCIHYHIRFTGNTLRILWGSLSLLSNGYQGLFPWG